MLRKRIAFCRANVDTFSCKCRTNSRKRNAPSDGGPRLYLKISPHQEKSLYVRWFVQSVKHLLWKLASFRLIRPSATRSRIVNSSYKLPSESVRVFALAQTGFPSDILRWSPIREMINTVKAQYSQIEKLPLIEL